MMSLLAGPYGLVIKAGVILAALASLYFYGYFNGKADVQEAWDASITRQATQTASQVIAEAVNTANAERQYIKVKGETEIKLKIVEREVVKYVETDKPCPVSPEFVRTFDAVSGVLDASEDRLPASTAATSKPDELPEAGLTTAQVLQAYYFAVEELTGVWLAYHALAQWEEGRYIVQKAAQQEDQ